MELPVLVAAQAVVPLEHELPLVHTFIILAKISMRHTLRLVSRVRATAYPNCEAS